MGQEKIQTASSSSMRINYVGNSTLQTPTSQYTKNLLSVHKLITDNPIFIEYHSRYFLVKDWSMKKIILQGRCKGGLYPWPSLEQSSSKCVFIITKLLVARWHDRLGHPSMVIVSRVVQENKLPCSSLDYNKESVCDAC
jgi:hypothetical protein